VPLNRFVSAHLFTRGNLSAAPRAFAPKHVNLWKHPRKDALSAL
jgi:hypothetical protein